MNIKGKNYLTREETAARLGITVASLSTLIGKARKNKTFHISPKHIGKYVFYKEEEVDLFLFNQQRKKGKCYIDDKASLSPFSLVCLFTTPANEKWGYLISFMVNQRTKKEYVIPDKLFIRGDYYLQRLLAKDGIIIQEVQKFRAALQKTRPLNTITIIGE